jgi:hypothetical protein
MNLIERIQSGKAAVGIVGLGYVGLPVPDWADTAYPIDLFYLTWKAREYDFQHGS